jgi:C1A family cysteine protease
MDKPLFLIIILTLIIIFTYFVAFTASGGQRDEQRKGEEQNREIQQDQITKYVQEMLENSPHKKGLSKELVDERKIIIQNNLDLIHVANIEQKVISENGNYSVTVFNANKFIPYTYDEIIRLFTGLIIPEQFQSPEKTLINNVEPNQPQESLEQPSNGGGSFMIDFDKIPSTEQRKDIFYEISPKLLGPVDDQGTCGSCWAFSACAVLGSQATKSLVAESPINVSVQHYIDCVKQNYGCEGGFPVYVYDQVADDGFLVVNILDINIPYLQEQNKECIIANEKSKLPVDFKGILGVGKDDIMYFPKGKDPTRIEKYRSTELNIPNDDLKEKIKKILFTYGPLTALIFVDERMPYIASGIYTSSDTKDGKKVNPNHAVVIAGYGVDLDGDDFWIIRNSWGKDWADGGCFQLSTKSPISGITLPFIGSEPPLLNKT